MNRSLLLFTFILFFTAKAFSDIELAGVYQGKNIYVQNPFTSNMKDYCTEDVYVNNVKVMASIQSSAFEIDLSFLEMDEPVKIRITHKSDCNPRILNPQVVQVKTTFSFKSINIAGTKIAWTAKNEKRSGRYFIERYEFNNWRTVAEVYGKNLESYDTDLHHHSGINRYRLKYFDDSGYIIYSDVVEHNSELTALEFYPMRVTDNIYLSREADFEVLDKYGNVINKGYKKTIELSQLPTGYYYLNADNRTFKFFKK